LETYNVTSVGDCDRRARKRPRRYRGAQNLEGSCESPFLVLVGGGGARVVAARGQ
jgi:hypothetical protein